MAPDRSAGRTEAVVRDWPFSPSPVPWRLRSSRLARSVALRRAAPASRVVAPAGAAARWTCYFMFMPDGAATAAHRFTLERLAAEPGKLLVVAASRSPDAVPRVVRRCADAVVWKDLPGFDFSGYSLALRHLAERSPGADVFLMNDSVLGPFASPAAALADAPWDLTGFTASSLFENHVQSYAWRLRAATPEKVAALGLPRLTAFNRYMDVVICQETRLARRAAASMTVGAKWFADHREVRNPSLELAVDLAREGLPFLKRSLLGKYRGLQASGAVAALLEAYGHPVEGLGG